MSEDNDKRPMTKQMAEAMILTRLYKDGLFIVDEEKKTADINMRRSRLVELYTEESYDDIRSIMLRTMKGLRTAGYKVTARWLDAEGVSSEANVTYGETELEKLQKVVDLLADGAQAETEDIEEVLLKNDYEQKNKN